MRRIEVVKNGKVFEVLEVDGTEVLELKNKFPFLSLSHVDENLIKDSGSSAEFIRGIIVGDIDAIDRNKPIEDPDCVFILDPIKHDYKRLGVNQLSFSAVVETLPKYPGLKAARVGWNGKRMWITYVPGEEVEIEKNTAYWKAGLRGKIQTDGRFDMYTAKKTIQPGWLASQADLLSDDWIIFR